MDEKQYDPFGCVFSFFLILLFLILEASADESIRQSKRKHESAIKKEQAENKRTATDKEKSIYFKDAIAVKNKFRGEMTESEKIQYNNKEREKLERIKENKLLWKYKENIDKFDDHKTSYFYREFNGEFSRQVTISIHFNSHLKIYFIFPKSINGIYPEKAYVTFRFDKDEAMRAEWKCSEEYLWITGNFPITEEDFVRKLFSKEKLILKVQSDNYYFDSQTFEISLNNDKATKEFFDKKFFEKYGCCLLEYDSTKEKFEILKQQLEK